MKTNLFHRPAWCFALALLLTVASPGFADSYATLDGRWDIAGNQKGRGDYRGTLTVARVGGDRYTATGAVTFSNGEERRIDGTGALQGSGKRRRFVLRYTISGAGVVDRLRDAAGGNSGADTLTLEARYKVTGDRKKMYGPWRTTSGRGPEGYDTLSRNVAELRITALEPDHGQAGDANLRLTVRGEHLPLEGQVVASDFAFVRDGQVDAGIRVLRVLDGSDDGTSLVIEASIARDAAPGARDLRLKSATGPRLFTVAAPDVRLPLGRSVTVPAGSWVKLFVPDAAGGELTLSAGSATLEVHRSTRDGAMLAPTSGNRFDLTQGGHGWLFVRTAGTGTVTVSNTLIQRAETPAEKKPWNFWYFPFFDRSGAGQNLYDDGGAYEKFDRAAGILEDPAAKFMASKHMDKEFKLPTDAAEAKRYNPSTTRGFAWCYQRSTDSKKSWWGHCWGAVVASSLYGQPTARTVPGPQGASIAFSEEEVEGLLTGFHTNLGCYPTNYLRDCPPGRPKEDLKEPVDRFADDFFLGLQQGIGRDGLPLASNLRAASTDEADGGQVWNHVIWKYEARFAEQEGKDDPTLVQVALDVTATDDVYPSGPTAHRDESYVLRFKYGTDGLVQRDHAEQNWVSASHFCPSYLWRIKSATSTGTENEVLGRHWDDLERMFEFPAIR